MLKNIARILPFLIITILCIGGVELFYGIVERFLLVPQATTQEQKATAEKKGLSASSREQHTNYQVITDRNLFRSYLKNDAAAETSPEEEKKDNPLEGLQATSLELILMGTIAGPAEKSRAVIMEKSNKKQDIYYTGDVIQQAIIKEIMRGKIILSYNGQDEILDMSEAGSVKPRDNVVNNRVQARRTVAPERIRRMARPTPATVEARRSPPPVSAVEEVGPDQDRDAAEPVQDDIYPVGPEPELPEPEPPETEQPDDPENTINKDGREL